MCGLGDCYFCDLCCVCVYLDRTGDLGELSKYGSLHQYLLHLHGNGEVPVTSFWWGKTHVVSVCSPLAFKELVGLVQRPGKGWMLGIEHCLLPLVEHWIIALLFKGFEPLIGSASIQYANGEDWELRQKCLYHTLKGPDLRSYFPQFVTIAKVRIPNSLTSPPSSLLITCVWCDL